ncbi:hypothetical protein BZG02_04975 [Labilibaculum filiforme]|uniref:Uncharacterized protein n=1 Tax=Labilibaculum filiforme TaxID=1940526 RepID=A0A2N3I1K1_9BACT|nr:hypothetical protein [Labilibaculum filiforme]PKQ64181.1 hypothetical protein BZG02_04975 [Labilibaculum filiforme]
MKNLQQLVQWTRFGLVSAFFIVVIIELELGVLAVSENYSFININDHFNLPIWKNVIGISMLIVEIILSEMIYKKKLEYVSLYDSLEEKLKYFRKAYSFKMIFSALAGLVSLLAYTYTQDLVWFLPWIMVLYTLSKSYPFKWTLVHAMQIENEEHRELF